MNLSRKKFNNIGIGISVVAFIAAIGMLSQIVKTYPSQPTDKALIENFSEHESIFNYLNNTLFKENKNFSLQQNFTDPDINLGIDKSTVSFYQKLMKQAHVSQINILIQTNNYVLEYVNWITGCAVCDDQIKGYAYLARRPQNLYANLDRFKLNSINTKTNRPFTAYRHITGNWYLYYQYAPDN